ncbi:MAG: MCE family protein [Spirulinaceae cyanobacterium RM2_2_10]|nr:MCE family protein [Spirulinaceae cyanobacterium RM2_2_10]
MREGSVGLLVLVGLLLFGSLTFWLRGFRFGRDSYSVRIVFANSNGMTIGGAVRYRGVKVGSITAIRPGTNGIEISVSIAPADLIVPSDIMISANQSGLISDTIVEMTPQTTLEDTTLIAGPLNPECDSTVILCDGDLLEGESGVSLDDALQSTVALSDRFADPRFLKISMT